MQLYICYDIDSLPLEQALECVSPQRRTQVLGYKPEGSRRRCAGAYLLLCHAFRNWPMKRGANLTCPSSLTSTSM